MDMNVDIYPVTPERWDDLEKLFGPRGACCGCWCMYWRLPAKKFAEQTGSGNRQALRDLIESKSPVGLLAYVDNEPAGWCALAPREAYGKLERSRVLKRVDDQPVWSIPCFFVARKHRHKGLTVRLLKAAVDYAAAWGASILEGYPISPRNNQSPDTFAYTGLQTAFEQAGFQEILRRSETRPIMRIKLNKEKLHGS